MTLPHINGVKSRLHVFMIFCFDTVLISISSRINRTIDFYIDTYTRKDGQGKELSYNIIRFIIMH